MPIAITANEERRRITAVVSGAVSFEQFVVFLQTARAGERQQWALLFDATQATVPLAKAQIQALASQVERIAADTGMRGPVALVAGSDLIYGLMRMYQSLCESRGIHVLQVFRSVQEGAAWLDAIER